jgi:hypothetical protein
MMLVAGVGERGGTVAFVGERGVAFEGERGVAFVGEKGAVFM